MLKLIQHNPYRYLGVCSNSPARERIANMGKLKAYLKVGKDVKFSSDLEGMLPALDRSLEGADSANSKINLPNDQLKYALFWFINVTPIDKMALDYLWMGNVEKSCEILGKKETYSSLINRGVLGFLQNDYASAVRNITLVIHNENHRTQFVDAVCGNTFQISEEELSEMFINALLEEIDAVKLSPIFEQNSCSQKDCELIKEKSTAGLIASINMAIESAKSIDRNDASSQLQAGKKLMTSTKSDLNTLCGVLGNTDMQYQMIADRLANQILQCGINYYNNTDEDDEVSVDKALNVQKYALKIAVGKLAKDRCRENCKILEDKKADLPPSSVKVEVKAIMDRLARFVKEPNKISYSISLMEDAKPHLQSMRNKLGSTDNYYLHTSSLIVNAALHKIIEEVNAVQSNPIIEAKASLGLLTSADLDSIKDSVKKAWKAMCMLDDFDKDSSCQSRFNTNKNSLKGLCNSLGVSTYSRVSTPNRSVTTSPATHTSSSSSYSSSGDFEWWPILKWIIGIIIFIIICANACD